MDNYVYTATNSEKFIKNINVFKRSYSFVVLNYSLDITAYGFSKVLKIDFEVTIIY
jgi:hypothetical protein